MLCVLTVRVRVADQDKDAASNEFGLSNATPLINMVKPITQTAVTVVKYNAKDPAAGLCLVRNAVIPETPPGHVLVNVQWRPINPSDIML